MEFKQLFDETLDKIGQGIRGIAVGEAKGLSVTEMALRCSSLDGDMAEVGAHLCGSARLISKTVPSKVLHVFDTFEGIPHVNVECEPADWLGMFKEDRDLYAEAKRVLDDCNVEIYKGIFPDTSFPVQDKKFCFVHADADVYQSTKDICEFFYPRLVHGAVFVFDDYGYEKATGCKKAVDDFFVGREKLTVLHTGQAFIVKTRPSLI